MERAGSAELCAFQRYSAVLSLAILKREEPQTNPKRRDKSDALPATSFADCPGEICQILEICGLIVPALAIPKMEFLPVGNLGREL
jgi:hypothetical protein